MQLKSSLFLLQALCDLKYLKVSWRLWRSATVSEAGFDYYVCTEKSLLANTSVGHAVAMRQQWKPLTDFWFWPGAFPLLWPCRSLIWMVATSQEPSSPGLQPAFLALMNWISASIRSAPACREAVQPLCGRFHACHMGSHCRSCRVNALALQWSAALPARHASSSGKLSTDRSHVCLQLTGTLPTWLGTLNVTQVEVEENQVEACCVTDMAHCLLLALCACRDQQRHVAQQLRYQLFADEQQHSS